MKLTTDIEARKDGTVTVEVPGDSPRKYTFKKESGVLVCDVTDENDAAYLIDTGNFFPLNDIAGGLRVATRESVFPGSEFDSGEEGGEGDSDEGGEGDGDQSGGDAAGTSNGGAGNPVQTATKIAKPKAAAKTVAKKTAK